MYVQKFRHIHSWKKPVFFTFIPMLSASEVCLCGRLECRIYNSMSLDGNGGKIGQTNLIIWLMLPVGVVMCMPGQYWVPSPLTAIIATRRHGIITTRRWSRSTWISAHLGDVALLEGNQGLSEQDHGQLVPKTTRTQDISYPRQLVPRITRTQDNSYQRRLVPNTTRT